MMYKQFSQLFVYANASFMQTFHHCDSTVQPPMTLGHTYICSPCMLSFVVYDKCVLSLGVDAWHVTMQGMVML